MITLTILFMLLVAVITAAVAGLIISIAFTAFSVKTFVKVFTALGGSVLGLLLLCLIF